ncbi:MAG: molybdopterin-dependent oxidoreductase [Acidisphaera sp.]|nr:molybdopterin-dependent oxidoreductase [Acidisphaera sp.]
MHTGISRRRFAGLLSAAATLAATRLAEAAVPAQPPALAQPEDKTILTVSGKISVFNKDDTAQFDRGMLEALGMVSFSTTTPWYNGPVTFEGVPMVKLLKAVGASGDHVTALALNDYSTDIPIEDFAKYNVILALKRDGNYMPVRDKGPLFIVYPFDSNPELQEHKYYARAAWQVSRLVVK